MLAFSNPIATDCVRKYAPRKLTFITSSKSSKVVSTILECRAKPALLTRISKGPLSRTSVLVLSISEISISRQFDTHPFKLISFEIFSKSFDLLEANVTDAPSEAKAQALAKPIPDEAPTTNAFFPVSLKEGISGRSITS